MVGSWTAKARLCTNPSATRFIRRISFRSTAQICFAFGSLRATYRVDVRVSDDIFKQLSEIYRKIRNTTRILLANLGNPEEDFNPDKDMVAFSELLPIDKWIVSRFNSLTDRVRKAYNTYEFHLIYHDMHNFCAIDLSKLYIDITKDRTYVESKNSAARRSAQTAMYYILSGFTRLIAPDPFVYRRGDLAVHAACCFG